MLRPSLGTHSPDDADRYRVSCGPPERPRAVIDDVDLQYVLTIRLRGPHNHGCNNPCLRLDRHRQRAASPIGCHLPPVVGASQPSVGEANGRLVVHPGEPASVFEIANRDIQVIGGSGRQPARRSYQRHRRPPARRTSARARPARSNATHLRRHAGSPEDRSRIGNRRRPQHHRATRGELICISPMLQRAASPDNGGQPSRRPRCAGPALNRRARAERLQSSPSAGRQPAPARPTTEPPAGKALTRDGSTPIAATPIRHLVMHVVSVRGSPALRCAQSREAVVGGAGEAVCSRTMRAGSCIHVAVRGAMRGAGRAPTSRRAERRIRALRAAVERAAVRAGRRCAGCPCGRGRSFRSCARCRCGRRRPCPCRVRSRRCRCRRRSR